VAAAADSSGASGGVSVPVVRASTLGAAGAVVCRVIVLLVSLLVGSQPSLLVPASGECLVGIELPTDVSRDSAVSLASPMVDSLAARHFATDGRVHGFLGAEYAPPCAPRDRIIIAPAVAARDGAPLCTSAEQRGACAPDSLAWCTLSSLAGTPVYGHAATSLSRALTYRSAVAANASHCVVSADAAWVRERCARVPHVARSAPAGWPATLPEHFRSGAMAAAPAATCRNLHALRSPEPFDAAVARCARRDDELRAALLATPPDDPQYAFLVSCADSIRPMGLDGIPPAYRQPGALPSFLDPVLRDTVFSHRTGPPTTEPWVPPEPYRQPPPPDEWPASISEVFPPDYFAARADPWFAEAKAFLVDVATKGVAGEVPPPEPLIFGQGEMLPQHRWIPYDFTSGTGVPSPIMRRVESHLDIDYLCSFADGYPDQEIFGCLTYGVSYKAGLGGQLVFQMHLGGIRKGFDRVQRDLKRRADLGWCGEYAHVPLGGAWQTLPLTCRERVGKPGKPRMLVDGGAPRRLLYDSCGIRVLPLNVAARQNEDVARGVGEVTFRTWDQVLRSTPGSPPPSPRSSPQLCERRDAPPQLCARRLAPPRDGCDGVGGVGDAAADAAAVASDGLCNVTDAAGPAAGVSGEPPVVYTPAPSAPPPRGVHLFSGAYGRPHGFANISAAMGVPVDEFDCVSDADGANLLDDSTFSSLLHLAESGAFSFVLAGVPCNTWSVARLRPDSRACQLRDRRHPRGKPSLGARDQRCVADANVLMERTLAIALAVHRAGGVFILEHPVDRAAGRYRSWEWRTHASLWFMAEVQAFALTTGARSASFPLCSFGAPWQKLTTLLYSPALDGALGRFDALECNHSSHRGGRAVGFYADGGARSTPAAAYPGGFAPSHAAACDGFVFDTRSQPALSTPRSRAAAGALLPPDTERDAEIFAAAEIAKFPKEVKMAIPELMSDMAVQLHRARVVAIGEYFGVTGPELFDLADRVAAGLVDDHGWLDHVESVNQLTDDCCDWFYQLKLAALDRHKVGFITLAFDQAADEDPELRFIVEEVLGQGTTPGSNYAQRVLELVLHIYRRNLDSISADAVAAERAARPAVDTWCCYREALSRRTGGRDEARWHCEQGYTDDTHAHGVGTQGTIRMFRAHDLTTTRIRLIMAGAEKTQIGAHTRTLGLCLNSGLGIAFIPEDKALRALAALDALVLGLLMISDYRSLLGLLEHLLFLANMRRSAMYGMYAFDHHADPASLVEGEVLTDAIVARAAAWRDRLVGCCGAPFTAAVAALARSPLPAGCPLTVFWRSDAAKEGTAKPGVAGTLGGMAWVRRFSVRELQLPIAVLEFIGHYGNYCVYAEHCPAPVRVVAELDALASPRVLAADAAHSPLMQLVHAATLELPGYDELASRLEVAHVYGAANPVADSWSRGYDDLARELVSQLGMVARVVPYPPQLDGLLEQLCVAHEAAAAHDTAIGMQNPHMTGTPFAHSARSQPPSLLAVAPGCTVERLHVADGRAASWVSGCAAEQRLGARRRTRRSRLSRCSRRAGAHDTSIGMHNACMTGTPFAQYHYDTGATAAAPTSVTVQPRASGLGALTAARPKRALHYDSAVAAPGGVAKVLVVAAVATGVAALVSAPAAAAVVAASLPLVSTTTVAAPSVFVYDRSQVDGPVVTWGGSASRTVVGAASAVGLPSHASGYSTAVAAALSDDMSPYALRPRDTGALERLCGDIFDDTYDNAGSRTKLDGNMRYWQAWCAEMGTPAWRPDYRGLSAGERRRESVLAAGFLPWLLQRMRGRRGCGRAQPASAFKVWLGVRKVHAKRDIELTPTKLVSMTVKRLCRRHLADFGADSLVPKRKEPFTRAMILALLRIPDGLRIGPYTLTWDSRLGRALRAFIIVLASTGMRKGEVSITSRERFDRTSASRANLHWRLRGRLYASPPLALLRAPQPGDCVLLRPPISKADQFGAVWGASPIYLAYAAGEPLCAFSALAAVEIAEPVAPELRASTPLFSPDGTTPFHAGHLDSMLRAMLIATVGVAAAAKYSWHSMRIWLACSLLASGASHAQIQALCRWRSDEALAIYARLNQTTYSRLLARALVANVSSVRASQLPDLEPGDVLRSFLDVSDETPAE
jgi:hypothetical protein